MQRRVRHAERLENRLQQRRNRRLANPAKTKRRHCDAQLAACQVGFDIGENLLRHPRADAVLARERVNAIAARLDQREFRRNKKRIRDQQQNCNKKTERCGDAVRRIQMELETNSK